MSDEVLFQVLTPLNFYVRVTPHIMKDQAGRVIGFEKLNFTMAETEPLQVAFEAMTI